MGVRGNESADRLAKNAVTEDRSSQPIPYTDLKSKTNAYIKDLFQRDWDLQTENKLHDIYPVLDTIPRYSFSSRKEETVFTRLRSGHSYLTHVFLLKGE